jgi:alcohol dehydrogenase class IV
MCLEDENGIKMSDIKESIIEEIKKLQERYDIQKKKIEDAGYSEDDLGNLLNKMVEQYPVLDRLWVREQLWSRIRGLEEVLLEY